MTATPPLDFELETDSMDAFWMDRALVLARGAQERGEVPVGALIVNTLGQLIGQGSNRREEGDPLGHAELDAIRDAAAAIGDWRLEGTTMFVTLEPCAMCAGAIVNSRIDRLVFGAYDPKAGFCGSLGNLVNDPRLNHQVQLSAGVRAEEAGEMLRGFFQRLRAKEISNR